MLQRREGHRAPWRRGALFRLLARRRSRRLAQAARLSCLHDLHGSRGLDGQIANGVRSLRGLEHSLHRALETVPVHLAPSARRQAGAIFPEVV